MINISPATHFEFVKRFADAGLELPKRGTANSAGYDLTVAEDIIIPRYEDYGQDLLSAWAKDNSTNDKYIDNLLQGMTNAPVLSLSELAALTKQTKAKPTLVSTGVKCYLQDNQYLELSVRSSTPLKYWLILANGVGIIDADYVDNKDNEGEIFLQLINLSPFDIQLHKGDKIGQGIIRTYEKTADDTAIGERKGGFGSTNNETSYSTTITNTKPNEPYVISIANELGPSFPEGENSKYKEIDTQSATDFSKLITAANAVGCSAEQVSRAIKKMSQSLNANRKSEYNG